MRVRELVSMTMQITKGDKMDKLFVFGLIFNFSILAFYGLFSLLRYLIKWQFSFIKDERYYHHEESFLTKKLKETFSISDIEGVVIPSLFLSLSSFIFPLLIVWVGVLIAIRKFVRIDKKIKEIDNKIEK